MAGLLWVSNAIRVLAATYVVVLPEECTVETNGTTLCVQELDCPLANQTFVRITDSTDLTTAELPGGITLYSTGTSLISCVACASDLCAKVNGTLPIIRSEEGNQCVLQGGRHGEKVRLPIAMKSVPGSSKWEWADSTNASGDAYTNWEGGGKAPDIAAHAMAMCTTMGPDGKWSPTPCDMSVYHTQKDHLICSVKRENKEEGRLAGSTSSAGTSSESNNSGAHVGYIVAPLAVLAVVGFIVLWRRSLDSSDEKVKKAPEIEVHHDVNYSLPENTRNIGTTDSNGYLVPHQNDELQTSDNNDKEEEGAYYSNATNDGDLNTNEESFYASPDIVNSNDDSDGEHGNEYDLAFQERPVISHGNYAYNSNENNNSEM